MGVWIWILSQANALTLDEAVARAGAVHPLAVAADLERQIVALEAAERWSLLTLTPEVSVERSWSQRFITDQAQLRVSTSVLSPAGWFDALEQSAQARASAYVASATLLDAQYAAAWFYVEAIAAEATLAAAQTFLAEAERTREQTLLRVRAGLEGDLMLLAAEEQLLEASSDLERARSAVQNSRARLSRAIDQEVDSLAPVVLDPPAAAPARSPWIDAQRALTDAAHLEQIQSWSELLPAAELQLEAPFGTSFWTLGLQATWSVDGAGPLIRARAAALAARQSDVLAEGLQRDHDLGVDTGREDARSLALLVGSARAREALAEQALEMGHMRLEAGLMDTLDVVRLQRDLVRARATRIDAELAEAYVVLEARRLAGLGW